jgi:hypothetical protein
MAWGTFRLEAARYMRRLVRVAKPKAPFDSFTVDGALALEEHSETR